MIDQLPYDVIFFLLKFIESEKDVISLSIVDKSFHQILKQIVFDKRFSFDSIGVKKLKLYRKINQLQKIQDFVGEWPPSPSVPNIFLIKSRIGFSHQLKSFFLKIGNCQIYKLFQIDHDVDWWYLQDHPQKDSFTINYFSPSLDQIHKLEINFLPEFTTTLNKRESPIILNFDNL